MVLRMKNFNILDFGGSMKNPTFRGGGGGGGDVHEKPI